MGYFQLVLLVGHVFIGLISASNFCEKNVSAEGRWTCSSNQHGEYNLIYDCLNSQKELYIWSWDYPQDMTSLTIQNCAASTLLIRKGDREGQALPKFTSLTIVNITELIVPVKPQNSGCLPRNVIFRNVNFNDLDLPLDTVVCDRLGHPLESLELKNVSIKALNTDFTGYRNLKKLVFNEVKIKSAAAGAIKIVNEYGFIGITNSLIQNVPGYFIDCKVARVIFSGNIIEHFTGDHEMFSLEAKSVILSGNYVDLFTSNTIKIISDDIRIVDNIFQRADDYIFDKISPNKSATKFSLDFSSNIIHSLAPKTLMFRNSQNELFTNLRVFNNKINCICENILWFDSVAKDKCNVRNYFAHKWAKRSNENKCLNIPDCGISQVLQNYDDLCENAYKCSESSDDNEMCVGFPSFEQLKSTLKLIQIACYCFFILTFFVFVRVMFRSAKRIKFYLLQRQNSEVKKRNLKHEIELKDRFSSSFIDF